MNPDRWRQVKIHFEKASEMDDFERAAYLDEVCREDPSLRREIDALLDRNNSDGFLEKPAHMAMPKLFEDSLAEELIGRDLGPYNIIRKIGSGGMGVVFLGRDKRLDRSVAIKMLTSLATEDNQQRERLNLEARAAARLSHPGIATVFSLEEYHGNLFMISEYVQGRTLRQLLTGVPLPFPQVLDIAIQLARALAAAHEQGIIHRDLKPENIILTDDGTVKVLDFGLARIQPQNGACMDTRLTRTGMFLGTPAYASPEQLLGNAVDHKTDLFSFGILLYELAAGRHPFGTTNSLSTISRILEGEAEPLFGINSNIPEPFDYLVRGCLKKNPEERHRSMRELLTALEQLPSSICSKPRPASNVFWWWQFHQAFAGFGYYAMLYPLWRVKEWLGGIEGSLLFFPALVAVGISANLRLHLWFMSRFYASELLAQRHKVSKWIRSGDWFFSIMLALTALRIHAMHAIIATLLMSVSIGSLIAFLLIEPATEKAALHKEIHPRRLL